MRLAIKNGRLIDPRNEIDARHDLYIAEGRIVGVDTAPAGFRADQSIDAAGLIVAPGLIDLSARLREPGSEHKATLLSELRAAVAGGITSVVCPPDTDPPLDEPGLVEMLKHRARTYNLAHVYPLGALTAKLAGERLTEMSELIDAGCIAFSQAEAAIVDTQVLWRAMQYAATFGYVVWLRPQEPYLAKNGVAHDGEVATRLGLPGIPSFAETIALDAIIRLTRHTGARVHICRLSCAESVRMIEGAKAEGLPITCDVNVHHLHLCDSDVGFFDSQYHVMPPFRTRADREALRAGVAAGTVDVITSDHTPVDDDEKALPFGESSAGATGLEVLLPLILKWAAETDTPLMRALRRVTSDPARILGIDAGHLSIGARADLTLFDPTSRARITSQSLRSQGKNSPFLDVELPGVVRATVVEGQVVFRAD